jgi:hypothetical protein
MGRQFLRHCKIYARVAPFENEEIQVQWALNMLVGGAIRWQDEQIQLSRQVPPPAHLTSWPAFRVAFRAQFADPHEADKALDSLMHGKIMQRTSVNEYNTQFNEALQLLTLDGNDMAILHAYTTGLKQGVHAHAIGPLRADPFMTFKK